MKKKFILSRFLIFECVHAKCVILLIFHRVYLNECLFFFKSFSTNGLRTIFFKDQRLEFYDIQDVTDAYHCAGNYCDIHYMVCLFDGV